MATNVIGPAKLAETLLPYLERSKRPVVMNMTSGLASIALDCGPKCAVYSISKTALNMLVSPVQRILVFQSFDNTPRHTSKLRRSRTLSSML